MTNGMPRALSGKKEKNSKFETVKIKNKPLTVGFINNKHYIYSRFTTCNGDVAQKTPAQRL